MNEQLALTIISSSVGFLAAIFFCIGNAFNTSQKILLEATPFWDFSEPVARALVAQRAQYVIGALLLVISFLLQIVAIQASTTIPASLPQCIHTWQRLVLAVLLACGSFAGCASFLIYKTTMQKVLKLEAQRRPELNEKNKK